MRYLINVIDDHSESGSPDEMVAIDAFNERLVAGGHWVFAAGLADPSASVVIDGRGPQHLVTDGPFIEAKEWVAGLWIIQAKDRDEALELMVEGSRACNRRLEVRPILGRST